MVYTEVKQRNGKSYYYRVRSKRRGKIISKERCYLGVNLDKKSLSLAETEANRKLEGADIAKRYATPLLKTPHQNIISKYELHKKSWLEKGVHGVLHYFFPAIEQTLKPMKAFYGDSSHIVVFFIKDDYIRLYWNNEDMTRLRTSFIQKVNKNTKELDKILSLWKKKVKIFNTLLRKIDQTSLNELTDEELISLYYTWYYAYLEEYTIATSIQESFSLYAEDFFLPHFREILEKQGLGTQFNEYYALLTSPIKESFITQEYRDRLKLLKEIKSGKASNIHDQLELHTKKYHWIRNNYAKDISLTAHDFRKLLEGIQHLNPENELKRLDKELQQTIKRKKEIVEELQLSKESRNLLKITELFSYMQDERKKYVLMSTYYQHLFIKEFAKRLVLEEQDLFYSYLHEIKDCIDQKKKLNLETINKRKKATLVIFTLEGYEILNGEDAENLHRQIFVNDISKTEQIQGTIASKGSATGIVKIVKKTHDFINFQEGDILVTSMTRPEMVILMEKAAAIVTDEGGITCHASIVSRELKKPCIIGTKIATQALKDGDVVEVNANEGFVKILKRK